MSIKSKIEREIDHTRAYVTYRINVWCGPGAVREVAQRVEALRGLTGPVIQGTEKIYFDCQAFDALDAMQYAAKILTYVGLPSLAKGPGFRAGLVQ
jgi:hypothetical protein